jgi:hypothetical protein
VTPLFISYNLEKEMAEFLSSFSGWLWGNLIYLLLGGGLFFALSHHQFRPLNLRYLIRPLNLRYLIFLLLGGLFTFRRLGHGSA